MPLEPLFVARAMERLKKVTRIRENLENQKNIRIFVVFKKQKVLTVPNGTLKTKDYEY